MTDPNVSLQSGVEPPVEDVLTCDDFVAFFQDIHGCEPFPWQVRLTECVLRRRAWPKVIDLPTGSGKTAVLDTAVFAMAAQPATSPRRIVFVIDRRIVVDQVFERARRIRHRLQAAATPVLNRVHESLRESGGGEPLAVAALRGGIPIDDAWAQLPDQPWVVVSTVDQFGSRLLFRGYGVTPRMRPIHAGLAGNDCLVFLDEVHLSAPFAETLARVAELPPGPPGPPGPLPRRFVTVEMSATPADTTAERFVLDPGTDLNGCPELRRRVRAAKRAERVPVRNRAAVPAAVLKIVKSVDRSNHKSGSSVRSIGVVVNRVRTARETHDVLAAAGYRTYLLTGRMRPLDRVDTLDRIGPVVNPDGERPDNQLTAVVATQAIEVGADFSFDALVTECAAVDSLRQRFGRLDRRGTWSERAGRPARAWILGPKSVVGSKTPDPVYGESVRETWEELDRRFKDGPLDVGPLALRDFPHRAAAPRPSAPLLLGTHMDAWVQTGPEPIVQPSIDWFLHGIDQSRPPEVSILWRFDRSSEALRLVPPRQAEFVQVPIAAVRSWLAGGPEVDVADVAQAHDADNLRSSTETQIADWVRWNGFVEGAEDRVGVDDIQPGDILVVDPRRGGLNGGTWDPSSTEPVDDHGDAAQIAYGRRVTLRLDPRLPHVDSPPTPAGEADRDVPVSDYVADWIEARASESDGIPGWMSRAIERLPRGGCTIDVVGTDDDGVDDRYYILTEQDRNTRKPLVDATTMDGSDEAGSFTGTAPSLRQHLLRVGERAGNIAGRLGLPHAVVADLRLAGELHDLGKVDVRFQLQLVGGDPVALEMQRGKPLAKSLPDTRRVWKYPKGMRHEVASVAMIESNRNVLESAHDTDLVLHLVATHHGFARPLPPIIEDPDPQTLFYELNGQSMEAGSNLVESSLALDMADRFWRLVERYGYHGLAWLEAILRLADHQQSAAESRHS